MMQWRHRRQTSWRSLSAASAAADVVVLFSERAAHAAFDDKNTSNIIQHTNGIFGGRSGVVSI